MHWIIGVSDASSISIGRILSPMMCSVTYGTTVSVRYYPSTALVLLWSSVLCRHRSRPLPSSPGLHSGSSQRLVTKNWKTEANLAENVEDDLRPLNFGLATARRHSMDRPAWHLLVDAAMSSWHTPERERYIQIVYIIHNKSRRQLVSVTCFRTWLWCSWLYDIWMIILLLSLAFTTQSTTLAPGCNVTHSGHWQLENSANILFHNCQQTKITIWI